VLHGRVVHIDRFGNLITNIPEGTLLGFLGADDAAFELLLGEHSVHTLRSHYAQVAPGELVVLVGSTGLVEVAAREASAALQLGIEVGRPLRVMRRT
jgi:S-adenosyl-L-methionine hydrolase (adenosine-forming)